MVVPPYEYIKNTKLYVLMGEFMVCELYFLKVVLKNRKSYLKIFLLQLGDQYLHEISICMSSAHCTKTMKQ